MCNALAIYLRQRELRKHEQVIDFLVRDFNGVALPIDLESLYLL